LNVTDKLKVSGELRGSRTKKDFTETLHYGYATSLYSGYNALPPDLEQFWASVAA